MTDDSTTPLMVYPHVIAAAIRVHFAPPHPLYGGRGPVPDLLVRKIQDYAEQELTKLGREPLATVQKVPWPLPSSPLPHGRHRAQRRGLFARLAGALWR